MASEYKPNFGVVSVTASTVAVEPNAYGGVPIVLDRAAGIAATLPAATGSGARYEFYVATTVTSNTTTIKVANASDTMRGNAIVGQDGGDILVLFEAGATADTVTLNGTTTGGLLGDFVILTDMKANLWHVRAVLAATGTEATPFSATV